MYLTSQEFVPFSLLYSPKSSHMLLGLPEFITQDVLLARPQSFIDYLPILSLNLIIIFNSTRYAMLIKLHSSFLKNFYKLQNPNIEGPDSKLLILSCNQGIQLTLISIN